MELEGRDKAHGKRMEGLDILLDFVGSNALYVTVPCHSWLLSSLFVDRLRLEMGCLLLD